MLASSYGQAVESKPKRQHSSHSSIFLNCEEDSMQFFRPFWMFVHFSTFDDSLIFSRKLISFDREEASARRNIRASNHALAVSDVSSGVTRRLQIYSSLLFWDYNPSSPIGKHGKTAA